MGDAFLNILIHENDRGVNAVMAALKEIGVLQYNAVTDVYRFKEMQVTPESLQREIDKRLK